jgi:putative CocE/NonD family hydrolase
LVQPPIAALRPAGLAAIAPFQIVDDVYRDVAYPGGVFDKGFAAFWGLADQPVSSVGVLPNDPCPQSFVAHEPATTQQNVFLNVAQHPFDDGYFVTRRTEGAAARIAVPVLGCETWQDDEVGSRPAFDVFAHIRRDLVWFVGSNGFHGQCDFGNLRMRALLISFFDRFVKGTSNGFERTPRAQVWHEAYFPTPPPAGVVIAHNGPRKPVEPAWVTTFPSWPPPTTTRTLYLAPGSALSNRSATGQGSASYLSAAPGPAQEDGVVAGENGLWSYQPVAPGTGLAWTSAALPSDLELLGPASADLWMTSTGADTTVQVTLTEVRPDGQETYVSRGWLRASHRALDRRRSTATRPYQTHLERDAAPMRAGVPALLRIEVFPFDHVFRAGSRLRLIVDTPSTTGGWSFADPTDAAQNAVLFDATHPSRLVLPVLPGGRARGPLPACGTVLNQPCRPSAY